MRIAAGRPAYVHLMHSGSDALTFAYWSGGRLLRHVAMSPEDGIVRDVGERLDFERPFWAGEHPVLPGPFTAENASAYPLPFHPLEFGGEALRHFFGFILEGRSDPSCFDPTELYLPGFRLTPTQADIQ